MSLGRTLARSIERAGKPFENLEQYEHTFCRTLCERSPYKREKESSENTRLLNLRCETLHKSSQEA